MDNSVAVMFHKYFTFHKTFHLCKAVFSLHCYKKTCTQNKEHYESTRE